MQFLAAPACVRPNNHRAVLACGCSRTHKSERAKLTHPPACIGDSQSKVKRGKAKTKERRKKHSTQAARMFGEWGEPFQSQTGFGRCNSFGRPVASDWNCFRTSMDDAMVWFANGPDCPQDFGFLKKFWFKKEAHFGAFFWGLERFAWRNRK